MYFENKDLYSVFTLDEMTKAVKECAQSTHLQRKATTLQLLPAALHIYLLKGHQLHTS